MTAVRIVQALIDTATCGLIALIAFLWEPDEKRKRRTSIAALALAALCPFTAIYVATILTGNTDHLLDGRHVFDRDSRLKATRRKERCGCWLAPGDCRNRSFVPARQRALRSGDRNYAGGFHSVDRASDVQLETKTREVLYRSARASYLGAVFSLAFCLVLVPWAIRNYRVFHFFSRLLRRTRRCLASLCRAVIYPGCVPGWTMDATLDQLLWALDVSPIKLADIPDRAFDPRKKSEGGGAAGKI